MFLEVQHKGVILPPPDMRPSVKRKASQDYCKFHKAKGHDTKDCYQLRNAIEDAVRREYLKDFIDLDRCNPERPTQRRKRDDDQDEERPTATTLSQTPPAAARMCYGEISTITGGPAPS